MIVVVRTSITPGVRMVSTHKWNTHLVLSISFLSMIMLWKDFQRYHHADPTDRALAHPI